MRICVIGAHGSGNRLNARMLQAAPYDWEVEVWSFPGGWAKAGSGFDAYIHSRRDDEMVARSMLKEGMVPTLEKAREWTNEAVVEIIEGLIIRGGGWLPVWLETTIDEGAASTIRSMADFLMVEPWSFDEPIYDANAQYRHHPSCDALVDGECSCR